MFRRSGRRQRHGAFRQSSELALYRHHLHELTRLKDHVLSGQEEELLSLAGEVLQGPANFFNMLSNADLTFPTIRDANGQEVALTHGRYVSFLQSQDRRVRREAFNGMFSLIITSAIALPPLSAPR